MYLFFYTELFNILSTLYITMKNRYNLNKVCTCDYLQTTCKVRLLIKLLQLYKKEKK